MALNFLRPGAPHDQPAGDLHAARSAIFVGVVNGLVSPPYLHVCLCGDGGRCDDAVEQEQRHYYQLANFLVAVLGVALLVVHMAFSAAVVASPLWPPVVRWIVWLTKVLTGGTLQFGINDLYFCLKILCGFMLVLP
ncbi:hypothetical protein ACP70R_017575 [Stipagrostis hirtigluma subsp. patula]